MASTASSKKTSGLMQSIQSSLQHIKKSPSRQPKPAVRKGVAKMPSLNQAVQTSYQSNDVHIPADFLTKPAYDAQPIVANRIDFAASTIPQYAGRYAVVIEHALSPSECATLLQLVEQSAQPGPDGLLWRPALVNVGGNYEIAANDYRKSDRIIWDSPEIVQRIVARCFAAAGVRDDLAVVERSYDMLGPRAVDAQRQRWTFARGNERMRFLRYRPGDFFDKHCDGSYEDPGSAPRTRSHYTLHLYLSDNKADGTQGGETTFWSPNHEHRIDVEPVLGRVLIFQHRGLLHSGEMVTGGRKFTMRTDLMYSLAEEMAEKGPKETSK